MSRNTRKITCILAPNSAAARSNRNTSAVGSNRKTARTNGGDASSDDVLPSAHVAAIDAPGIKEPSVATIPVDRLDQRFVRLMGYLPGQMFPLSRH